MKIVDTLEFLRGTWTLERSLTDHRSGTVGWFEGKATIAPAPSGHNAAIGPHATYDESGTLRFGGRRGPATRSLQLVRLQTSVVLLHFSNGDPFVDLDLRSGTWRSVHPCREDNYETVTVAILRRLE